MELFDSLMIEEDLLQTQKLMQFVLATSLLIKLIKLLKLLRI